MNNMREYFNYLRTNKNSEITVVLSGILPGPSQAVHGSNPIPGPPKQLVKIFNKIIDEYEDAVLFSNGSVDTLVPYSAIIEVQVPAK